jgi:hypothetical protein
LGGPGGSHPQNSDQFPLKTPCCQPD